MLNRVLSNTINLESSVDGFDFMSLSESRLTCDVIHRLSDVTTETCDVILKFKIADAGAYLIQNFIHFDDIVL